MYLVSLIIYYYTILDLFTVYFTFNQQMSNGYLDNIEYLQLFLVEKLQMSRVKDIALCNSK
jgi:hypothetical protein